MKKSRIWLLRFFSLAVIISVLFSLAIPASAERYDGANFIESIHEYNGIAEIIYRIPAELSYVCVFDVTSNWQSIYSGSGVYHDIGFVPGHMYQISICPLGYRSKDDGFIASTIPSSFNFRLGYGYLYENGDDTGYATIVEPFAYAYVYNETSNTVILKQSLNFSGQNGQTQVESYNNSMQLPEGAYTFCFEFKWDNVSWESDPIPTGIYVDDFWMTCHLSADLLDRFYWQWTNGIIGDINDSINGPATPVPPSDIDSVDDLQNMEEELLDYIDGQIGNLDGLLEGFNDVIMEIGPSLLFVSWIIDLFTSMSFFTKLINVVISLGITSFVLNLVISFVHSRTENNKSSEAHKDQKGG